MAYFKSQILPSKLTYRTVTQDVQISSDSAYVPVTFSTIQGLKYVTVKLTQDRGGGTVYEGSATIPVSKISGSSAKVAIIYLNNNFVDTPFKVDLSMSYTGASVDYSGSYYNMYITILGFPMDIFAPLSLDKTPFIMPSGAQKITLPLTTLEWDKLETKTYADGTKTSSSKEFNIIGGNTWNSQNRSLCSRVNVGSWRLTYQFGNQSIDQLWFGNINNKTTTILLENNSYTIDGTQYTGTVPTSMIEDTTVIFADDSHYDDGVALSRTKIYNSDVLQMDLIPINDWYKAYIFLENGDLTGYGGVNYNGSTTYMDPSGTYIRDKIVVDSILVASDGTEYPNRTVIPFSDYNGNYLYNTVYTEAGVILSNRIRGGDFRLEQNLPSGYTHQYVNIYIMSDTKEGGFYDTIGDIYYFSETSTPLVYTEL